MLYIAFVILFIVLNIFYDINYFARTFYVWFRARYLERRLTVKDTTTLYGFGTFGDCDINLKHVRSARIIRELDFARVHFYERLGLLHLSRELKLIALQGSTLAVTVEPVPIFTPYKITTKLVFWDEQTVCLEHQVITILDGKSRCVFVSRQHPKSETGNTEDVHRFFKEIQGLEAPLPCPEYIKQWLSSMEVMSAKLRAK